MNRYYLFFILCCLKINTMSAQTFNYGVNGGITTSTIIGLIPVATRRPTEVGYTGGAFVRYYPEDNQMIGVTLGIRYNTMSSSTFVNTQTTNALLRIEETFEHDEKYLRIDLSGEFKLISGSLPLYVSVGLSGHNVLEYREVETTSRIITDNSSPPSVQTDGVDYDHHLFLGPHGGLDIRYKQFSLGINLCVFQMKWDNGPLERTSRFEFLTAYTF